MFKRPRALTRDTTVIIYLLRVLQSRSYSEQHEIQLNVNILLGNLYLYPLLCNIKKPSATHHATRRWELQATDFNKEKERNAKPITLLCTWGNTIVSRRPLPGKRLCIAFHGVNIAASIQMCAIHTPGKRPYGQESQGAHGHLPGILQ